ncbi:MAG: hypothetical protein M0R17_06030 [Candidatus Omnitrophica bacterium]|jgi:hypothetical protein|nr:hypothetical protein [Candidatus Omnitrophota bacterium]
MGKFIETLKAMGEKSRERKEKIRELDEDMRVQKLVEERTKQSNERELEKYIEEDRQKNIKDTLELYRKKRQKDIDYGHNPLMVKNITNKSDFSILKQKNLFKHKGNMFQGQKYIHQPNKKLLLNGNIGLCSQR